MKRASISGPSISRLGLTILAAAVAVACGGGDGSSSGTTPPPPTPAGVLQFTASATSVGEVGGSVVVTVSRTGGTSGSISVSADTFAGTATGGGVDYTSVSDSTTWADGDGSSKDFTVPIADDTLIEGDETFTVTLSAPGGGATLGTPSTITVTILDDDSPPPPGATPLANETPVLDGAKEYLCPLSTFWQAVVVSYFAPAPSNFDLFLRATVGGADILPGSIETTLADLIVVDGNNGNAPNPFFIDKRFVSGTTERIERSDAGSNSTLVIPGANNLVVPAGRLVECWETPNLTGGQGVTVEMRLQSVLPGATPPDAYVMFFRPTTGVAYHDNALGGNGYRLFAAGPLTTTITSQSFTAPVSGYYGVVAFLQYESTSDATFFVDFP